LKVFNQTKSEKSNGPPRIKDTKDEQQKELSIPRGDCSSGKRLRVLRLAARDETVSGSPEEKKGGGRPWCGSKRGANTEKVIVRRCTHPEK